MTRIEKIKALCDDHYIPLVPELLELVQEMALVLELWASTTGGQYNPVKERVTETALAKYKAWNGEYSSGTEEKLLADLDDKFAE